MHDAMTSGNTELTNQYRTELGLGLRDNSGRMLRQHSNYVKKKKIFLFYFFKLLKNSTKVYVHQQFLH